MEKSFINEGKYLSKDKLLLRLNIFELENLYYFIKSLKRFGMFISHRLP